MGKYFKVVTDGKIFRIVARSYGGNDKFVSDYNTGKAREFSSKEDAERHIHYCLSMNGWHAA